MKWSYGVLAVLLLSSTRLRGQPNHPGLPSNHLEQITTAGPRRWRGTVGSQRVTLQLDSGHWGYSGSYYYDHRGQQLTLSQTGEATANSVTLQEEVNRVTTGYFECRGPVGPKLRGTWRSADGRRRLPFVLHEIDADALAYDEETWHLKRFTHPESDSSRLDSADFRQTYLRVRQPSSVAARRLQAILGPPQPASRMAHYLDSLLCSRQEDWPDYSFSGNYYVVYNSNYLLSVEGFEQFGSTYIEDSFGAHEWGHNASYNLRTGRRLQLDALLLPGYEPHLRRLLLRQLQSVWQNAHYEGLGANGRLPVSGFCLTATGLRFIYDDRDDEALGYPGPYHADRQITVELSYETLMPVLRLDGPLQMLLEERQLMPARKPATSVPRRK